MREHKEQKPEWAAYGEENSGSRWFAGEPTIERAPVRPVMLRWRCPIDGGEMVSAGWTWPTFEPGYHHTCDRCGFTAALSGQRFPRVEYEPAE